MPRWVLCGEADGGRVGRERRETWLFRWWRGALTDRRRVGAPPQSEGRERRETGLFRWWRGALTERRGLGAPPQCGELAGNVSTPSTRWRAFQEETIGLLVNIYFKTYIYLFLLKKKNKTAGERARLPSPVCLPGKSHGQKRLAGCSHGVTKSQTRLSN